MEIIEIEAGPVATIGYLVIDTDTRHAVIIDTPLESTTYFNSLIEEKQLKIDGILLTHTHWDHIADCNKLARLTKAPVYAHEDDLYRLTEPMKHTIIPLPFKIEAVENVVTVSTGSKIAFGDSEFTVYHTPGHTEGGVCYVNHSEGVIFAGDTLFNESIGRVDLPGGSMSILLDSINNVLMPLPDKFRVYSGHGPATTIGWEKKHNPFLV